MTEFSVQDILQKSLENDREERAITSWHASGLGSCLTTRYLERSGVDADTPFDPRILRVFSVGQHFEDWLADLVEKHEGVKADRQVRVEWPEYNLTGKCDQVFSKPRPYIYEYKTMHSRAFWHMNKEKVSGKPNHQMQLWVYLERLGIDEGRLVYFSKDDLAISEFQVLRSDESIKNRVIDELKILNAAWKAQLPPPPLIHENDSWRPMTTKDWQCKYSRWNQQIFIQPQYLSLEGLDLHYPVIK